MKSTKKLFGMTMLILSCFLCVINVKAGTVTSSTVACPSFSFVDHNGNSVNNTTIAGKTTIMMFTTDYCTYGKAMVNEIGKSDWFPNDNVNFVFGMLEGTQAGVQSFQQTYAYDGIQFCYTTTASDMTRTAFNLFHQTGGTGTSVSTPLTFIIDSNGVIRYCMESYVPIAELETYVDDYADLTYSVNDANVFSNISEADRIYNGTPYTPSVTVSKWYYNQMLYSGKNYTVTYENNINAGTAYAVITGKGYMIGTKKIPFYISPRKLTSDCISPIVTQYYTGETLNPSFSVICNGKTLTVGKDYSVTYSNNVNPGTGTVTITGIGNYTGTVSKNFNIKKITSFTVNKQKYEVTSTAKKTVQYTGNTNKKSSVTIPPYVTYQNVKYKVTTISAKAFTNNKKVTSISIASSITKIPNNAFQGCTGLKTVTLGTGITTIGKKAFYGCKKLNKITIKSEKLKSIGSNALKGVSKKCTVKVPKAKVKAYKKLFKNKGLKSVKVTK